MALITCPICGKIVSDKVDHCIRCGYSLNNKIQKRCIECGEALDENATYCSKCGCPVENSDLSFVETSTKKRSKKSFKIFISIAVAILFVVGLIIFNNIRNEYIYNEILTNYYNDMTDASINMLSDAVIAEECGNLIINVWHDAIWYEYDDETKKYTMENGVFVSDFNEALDNLYEDESFTLKLQTLSEGQSKAASYMKTLNDPPEEYELAFNAFSEMYDAYIAFTNMILTPNGSYNSFSEDFPKADVELVNKSSEFKLFL